jgi:TonB-dependent receptor
LLFSKPYLNVTVDGVRLPTTDALERGVDLSAISQSSLAGIELYKAITPDKDADAIAGSINLVTKKAPQDREFRFIGKGGYNDLMDSYDQYDFSFKYGERFFDNFLGVQVNGNIEQKIRSNESIDIGYDQTIELQTDYEIDDLELTFTDETRERRGLGLILDFDTPDEGNIKLNTIYSFTKRDYLTHSRNYPRNDDVTYSYRDREQEIDMFSSALIGENHLSGLDVNWGVSYAKSEASYPYDYELIFVESSDSGTSGMRNLPGDLDFKTNPEILIDYAYNNFAVANLFEAFYRTQENSDKDFTTYLDLFKEYNIGNSISGEVKGGFKYRSKNKTNANTRLYSPYRLLYWREYELLDDGSIVDKDFSGSYFEDYYQRVSESSGIFAPEFYYFLDDVPKSRTILDDFTLYPLINRDKLRQWYDINKNGINKAGTNAEYHNDPSAEANTYDITESVTSAYLMNTLKIGQKITMILGARVEHESHEYENKYSPNQIGGFPIPVGVTRDTNSTYSETIFLPHLHLNIATTNFMNIRIAAYRAVARPDFNMRLLSSFAWRDSETGGDRQHILGNPNLKTAKAWNFELSTAFYSNTIGLFTVSGFYKRIDDMYHMLDQITTEGDTLIKELGADWEALHKTSYELTMPYNSPEASEVYGFEVDHQINFIWLPGLLKNLILSYNFTFVDSETLLIGSRPDSTYVYDPVIGREKLVVERVPTTYTQELENQPEFFGNVSIGYDIGGFSGRLSLFHQSEYYRLFSSSQRSDRIIGDFTRLDLALKYKFVDYITVLCNVNNLTNIKEEDLMENRVNGYTIPRITERYGLTFDLGLRVDL